MHTDFLLELVERDSDTARTTRRKERPKERGEEKLERGVRSIVRTGTAHSLPPFSTLVDPLPGAWFDCDRSMKLTVTRSTEPWFAR